MSAPPYPLENPPYPGQQPPGVYPPHAYQQQQQYAAQNAASTPLSQVELHISCRDLLDMDTFSKSDPVAVLNVFDKTKKSWKEYGRTEVIMDNLNPDFAKSFVMDYYFEEVQKLRFEVYDIDNASQKLSKQDFIGFAELNLGAILGENSGRYQSKLSNPKFAKCGSIIITAEEVSACKDVVTLQFCGRKLDKKDFFGKSDPFLTISRCNEDNSFSVVHRTEVKKTTLKPNWLPFKLPARTLCNGDYDRTLKFECFDWNSNGSHSLIGEFQTCLRDLKSFRSGRSSYELINPKYKAKKKSYKNSGLIDVLDCKIEVKHSFLEYIRGGTELCFVVAIDFTASNGAPHTPSSLHYVNPYSPNQYVQALNSVGRIIEDYDSDKLFPAFGFGAKILSQSPQVQHQFALNFIPSNPNCQGVDGIVAAYYNCVNNCTLFGPTNFAPVINNTASIAEESAKTDRNHCTNYYVLLIITDGIITDMERTKEAIVKASFLPMSLIIVGVGPAEFDAMEELDGDDVRLSFNGRKAERDIVQFVPFRDYLGRDGQYNANSGERLAKDVLAELPGQLEEYMELKKIKPGNTTTSPGNTGLSV
eukprot:Seg2080.8 transcript_id=Seg2080.8/GoldUCD/mRNA.D3Y31 product=Copine-8 protein_id=Seg2080.8/GoldUCD/D3Y31